MFQNIIQSIFRDEYGTEGAPLEEAHEEGGQNGSDDFESEEKDPDDPNSSCSDCEKEGYDTHPENDTKNESNSPKLKKDSWVADAQKGEFDNRIFQSNSRQRKVARDDSDLGLYVINERRSSNSSG